MLKSWIIKLSWLCLLGMSLANAATIPNAVTATYSTPLVQSSLSFKPIKRVVQFGYQGTFNVAGRNYPGVLYSVRGTSTIGMVWYYGVTGIQAGTAVVNPLAGTALYTGTIQFTDRRGQTLDSGTISANIK